MLEHLISAIKNTAITSRGTCNNVGLGRNQGYFLLAANIGDLIQLKRSPDTSDELDTYVRDGNVFVNCIFVRPSKNCFVPVNVCIYCSFSCVIKQAEDIHLHKGDELINIHLFPIQLLHLFRKAPILNATLPDVHGVRQIHRVSVATGRGGEVQCVNCVPCGPLALSEDDTEGTQEELDHSVEESRCYLREDEYSKVIAAGVYID